MMKVLTRIEHRLKEIITYSCRERKKMRYGKMFPLITVNEREGDERRILSVHRGGGVG